MKRRDELGASTFACSCGSHFVYTNLTLMYLREWLERHREHDTSKTELEISDELTAAMGWPRELVQQEIQNYNELATKYRNRVS